MSLARKAQMRDTCGQIVFPKTSRKEAYMSAPIALKSDIIVVGSGPGGATLARELTRLGKKVLLLERGIDYRTVSYYGTYLGALIYSDRMSLLVHGRRAEHRPAADGRRRDEHVLRVRCAATRVAQGQVRRRHRCRSLRDDGGAGDRPAARRVARPGIHPHRPGSPGAGLRLAAPTEVHPSAAAVAASMRNVAPGACSAAGAAPSGMPPSTWTTRWPKAPICKPVPASNGC